MKQVPNNLTRGLSSAREEQTRVERQEKAHCNSLSFDRDAANSFQLYVNETLLFAVKRGGIMYGTVNDEGDVSVHFIYEPPQQASDDRLMLLRDPEEERPVDTIASGLAMTKVGSSRKASPKGTTLSNAEIRQAAELQAESGFDKWANAIVKLEVGEDGTANVHFEAFQLSDLCVKLWKEQWFIDAPELDPKLSKMKSEVVVLGKDTRQRLLEGPLSCGFPVEYRVIQANMQSLKAHLDHVKSLLYFKWISNVHLLLFLSNFLDVNTDLPQLTFAIFSQGPVPDGYQLLINSLASDGFQF